MKRLFSLLLAFLAPVSAASAGPDPQSASTNAAKEWLVLIDQGNYRACWNEASPSLKSGQPCEVWVNDIAARHDKAGAVIFREVTGYRFKPARTETALHAAEVRFRSQYQNGLLKETVKLELVDDRWRTAEYSLG